MIDEHWLHEYATDGKGVNGSSTNGAVADGSWAGDVCGSSFGGTDVRCTVAGARAIVRVVDAGSGDGTAPDLVINKLCHSQGGQIVTAEQLNPCVSILVGATGLVADEDNLADGRRTIVVVDWVPLAGEVIDLVARKETTSALLAAEIDSYLAPIVAGALNDISCVSPGVQAGAQRSSQLSRRQRALLHLLRAGLRTKQMARELGVSVATIKRDLGHIYSTYGVADRIEFSSRYAFGDSRLVD